MEESKLSGKWYQVCRYLVHDDFLERETTNEWKITYKQDSLLDLEIKVSNLVYGGYMVINKPSSSINILVSIKGITYELGIYYLLYRTEDYMLLGNTKDMFIFSSRAILEPTLVTKLAQECGYDPLKLVVNRNYQTVEEIIPLTPIRITKRTSMVKINDNNSAVEIIVKPKK